MTRTRLGVAVAVVSLLLLGAACSSDDNTPDLSLPDDVASSRDDDSATETADPLQGEMFHVAQAVEETLVVRASAQQGADELVTLSAADETSGKVVCLVEQQVGEWVEVHLPSGPGDRTGWVARDDVTLSRHRFRLEVSLSEHTLTLYTGEIVALTAPVGLGPDAPPAGEERFIKDLVQPPDPAGPYGPYAYGLSGSDNQLANFTSGSGVVALHGTGDPTGLGAAVPYGSIAVGSDIVTRLADTIGLPLGTPLDIVE
jgi:lipoprotein-anchoring transpeptidase ErfK/SrfK